MANYKRRSADFKEGISGVVQQFFALNFFLCARGSVIFHNSAGRFLRFRIQKKQLLEQKAKLNVMTITMENESKQQIFEKRKEVEQEFLDMLKETKSDFSLDDIKEIIYNEDGQDSLTDIIAMFDTGQGAAELQNILELVNEAWNYFPHKVIDGLSPAEKLLEYKEKQE